MKKIFLTIVVTLGLAFHVHSRRVNFGPKVGGNFSFINNLDKIQLKKNTPGGNVFDILRNAFHWGAYCEYMLNTKWGIGTELVYTRVGSIYKNMALKLSYINIPIWITYYFFSPLQGFSFYLGPSLNFLWHAAPVNLSFFIQEKHIDPFEWAIVGGLHYLFGLGLSIDLRYNWGLSDIFDFQLPSTRLPFLKGIQLTNHCLQLSISYNFGAVIH